MKSLGRKESMKRGEKSDNLFNWLVGEIESWKDKLLFIMKLFILFSIFFLEDKFVIIHK